MIFSWTGACCAGVVVIHIAAMHAALVPVVKALDWRGGLAAWVLGAVIAGVVTAAVCAAATIVATAAVICVLVATIIAAATVCVLVATTIIVSAATVAAASTVVATAMLSMAVSTTWALLVVDDARWGLVISDGLAEHLEFPLNCHDVGRVGLE